jgi:hypothetical protein
MVPARHVSSQDLYSFKFFYAQVWLQFLLVRCNNGHVLAQSFRSGSRTRDSLSQKRGCAWPRTSETNFGKSLRNFSLLHSTLHLQVNPLKRLRDHCPFRWSSKWKDSTHGCQFTYLGSSASMLGVSRPWVSTISSKHHPWGNERCTHQPSESQQLASVLHISSPRICRPRTINGCMPVSPFVCF